MFKSETILNLQNQQIWKTSDPQLLKVTFLSETFVRRAHIIE